MTRKNFIHQDQMTLPFGQTRAWSMSLESRERAFWSLVAISLLSLAVYFYAINAAAHNIAIRQNLESRAAEISGNLASLEFASIELKNSVTIETARELGFKEVKKPLYVSRNANSALTFNTVTR